MDEQITILIVDDDVDMREILGSALSGMGYRVLFAENGAKGYQKAVDFQPDVILLDVMMPVMDGYELCRRLRATPQLYEIPILILTALNDTNSRLAGIEAGADDFITKPYDRTEIKARVKSITRLNRYRRLMAERAKVAWVVDQAADAYFVLNPKGEITYANNSARVLFNLPPAPITHEAVHFLERARTLFTLMPAFAWDQWQSPAEVEPDLPLYLIHPQDEHSEAAWFQVSLLHLPWDAEGSVLVRIAEFTRRITFEQEVWSFQSAVSHKFNTPLSTILMASGLVRFYGDRLNMPDLTEYANAIELGAKRLEGEINDIIEYAGAPSLIRGGENLSLADLPRMVTSTAADLGMNTVRIGPVPEPVSTLKAPLSIRAMQSIVWELLDNARKFHPEQQPAVDVEIIQPPQGGVLVRVQDNGLWLSPEQLTKAVVPYYQGEKTFTGEVSGMGLGLPMAASLLWAVGGDIHLYNRMDTPGVVVEISLPVKMN